MLDKTDAFWIQHCHVRYSTAMLDTAVPSWRTQCILNTAVPIWIQQCHVGCSSVMLDTSECQIIAILKTSVPWWIQSNDDWVKDWFSMGKAKTKLTKTRHWIRYGVQWLYLHPWASSILWPINSRCVWAPQAAQQRTIFKDTIDPKRILWQVLEKIGQVTAVMRQNRCPWSLGHELTVKT